MDGARRPRWRRLAIAAAAVAAVPIVFAPGGAAASTHPSSYGNGGSHPTVTTTATRVDPTVAATTHHSSGGLPFTGGDILALTFIGLGLALMGSAVAAGTGRRSRRRDVADGSD